MNVIYKPKGRALEYSYLAANLYRGCSHKCLYCFAPATTRKEKTLFHSKEFVQPRKDVLKNLNKELKDCIWCPHNVLLSFTTDPYQPIEEKEYLTRSALDLFNRKNVGVTILTKGGKLARRDFDILKLGPRNQFGVTLTCISEKQSLKWEPSAALPEERIANLRSAHRQGIKTYVSFEPVLYPKAVYDLIQTTRDFVDFYKIGKLNYHPHAKRIDWVKFRQNVTELLYCYGKEYMLKKDLIEAK